jgi:hypothetical protein
MHCPRSQSLIDQVERPSARPENAGHILERVLRSAVLVRQVQKARLLVAVGSGALRHGAAVIVQLRIGRAGNLARFSAWTVRAAIRPSVVSIRAPPIDSRKFSGITMLKIFLCAGTEAIRETGPVKHSLRRGGPFPGYCS